MALLSMVRADAASSHSGGHRLRNVELVSMLTAEFMRSLADESSTVWTILAEILALLLDSQTDKPGGQRVKPTALLRGKAMLVAASKRSWPYIERQPLPYTALQGLTNLMRSFLEPNPLTDILPNV